MQRPDDLESSPDAAVRTLAALAKRLNGEMESLRRMLETYAAQPRTIAPSMPEVSDLEHYPFTEGAECGCATCGEWTMRRSEFIEAVRLVPKGHKWTTCGCTACRFVGRIHLNYLAATNRRDLLIETSYHAKHHSPFGTQVMDWLRGEMRKPAYTVNWCAQEMSRFPLEWWLRRCEAALSPVVSGKVFRDSMMAIDMRVHFASSLTAEGSLSG